jgi:zinc transporter
MNFPSLLAFRFDRKGSAIAADPAAPIDHSQLYWFHARWEDASASTWLTGPAALSSEVYEALTAPETRPRCTVMRTSHGDGAVINLRGVNLQEGAEPEDMISLRVWLEDDRIISTWRRPLHAIDDLMDGMERGRGPVSPGDFVAKLALRLADRAEPVVATLNEAVDTMEEGVLAENTPPALRGQLADVRRTAIVLRRFMFPQRDALSTLAIEDLDWLTERDRSKLREATDRITRLAAELDAIRERAAVVHEQLVERRAEAMNRNMLVLAVVAAIFLPLGLLTGLLGINVGGLPGAGTSWAFWVVCALLGMITVFNLWLYKRLKLF